MRHYAEIMTAVLSCLCHYAQEFCARRRIPAHSGALLFLLESCFLVRRCVPRALHPWLFLSFDLPETEGSVL